MASAPPAPADPEVLNVIDKLAQFVARNGAEFEQMTKQKQADNPKFAFLFGGEFYPYYQYKIAAEQAILRKQHSAAFQPSGPQQSSPEVERLEAQIRESEENLTAQRNVLLQQREQKITEAITQQYRQLNASDALKFSIDLNELDHRLQPLQESCGKESIVSIKTWLLQQCASERHAVIILRHLLIKATESSLIFNFSLHILYLINDLLHHCSRKSTPTLMAALQDIVPELYCAVYECATNDQQKDKLLKLTDLWKRNTYFSTPVLARIARPVQSHVEYQQARVADNQQLVQQVSAEIDGQLRQYEQQHDEFVRHCRAQITRIRAASQQSNTSAFGSTADNQRPRKSRFDMGPAPAAAQGPPPSLLDTPTAPPPGMSRPSYIPPRHPPPHFRPPLLTGGGGGDSFPPPNLSLPPPQIRQPLLESGEDPLRPRLMYYDLPAGLMVSALQLSDKPYTPIDPADLRLPPPSLATERLMAAMEQFYAPPSFDRPRDSEGWEKSGLQEFTKNKEAAMKEHMDEETGKVIRGQTSPRFDSAPEISKTVAPGAKEKQRSPSPAVMVEESPPRMTATRRSPPQRRPSASPPRRRSISPPQMGGGLGAEPKLMADERLGLGAGEVYASATGDPFDTYRRQKSGQYSNFMQESKSRRTRFD